MKISQLSLFDEEKRYAKLTELGDPLEKLDSIIDWEIFRKNSRRCVRRRTTQREDAHP